jgi:hypothetical protein
MFDTLHILKDTILTIINNLKKYLDLHIFNRTWISLPIIWIFIARIFILIKYYIIKNYIK